MAGESTSPTISLGERSLSLAGRDERLSKWLFFSLALHGALILSLFLMPFLPSRSTPSYPIYTVDLVGGEKIGGKNLGTELPSAVTKAPPPKTAPAETLATTKETKQETKKEKPKPIEEKAKAVEKAPIQEKVPITEA